ncbi:MAG: type II secretion system ATPase GspE [bacterium]
MKFETALIKEEDKKFGQLLVSNEIINRNQLEAALNHKQHHDDELANIVIENGFADAESVYVCLADYLNLPFIDLKDYSIDPDVLEIIPKEFALQYKIFPVFKIENSLTVAMANPGDVRIIDTLHRECGSEIEPAVCLESDIHFAIEKYYGISDADDSSIAEVIQEIEFEKPEEEEITSAEKLKQLSADAPVVKLVNLIISQGIRYRASDIHIEPEEKSLQIRYRIDGILHEKLNPPKHLQAAIISRIKILASLDIAENRIPQDGRFQVAISGRDIDIRVSTLPTVYGENVVLRILDKSNLELNLEQLGLEPEAFKRFKEMLSSSYGVLLVSGPTGSGKTTTLYTALQSINTVDKNIITIEDPVEYRLRRIRQSQVNVKAGLTFASGLRSILRQDPDVIMVGEIRDAETARIAVESALTGHLVLSTIHTNDAPGGLTRLTEMGVEPFLTASAAIGIIAQRLVRKLCSDCRKPYQPNAALLSKLGLQSRKRQEPPIFYKSVGCNNCNETGYRGRHGIYEVMQINEEIRELALQNAATDRIKQAALRQGMHSLRQDGLIKVIRGLTSLEEVFRVTNMD